jgi:hypothetical protein
MSWPARSCVRRSDPGHPRFLALRVPSGAPEAQRRLSPSEDSHTEVCLLGDSLQVEPARLPPSARGRKPLRRPDWPTRPASRQPPTKGCGFGGAPRSARTPAAAAHITVRGTQVGTREWHPDRECWALALGTRDSDHAAVLPMPRSRPSSHPCAQPGGFFLLLAVIRAIPRAFSDSFQVQRHAEDGLSGRVQTAILRSAQDDGLPAPAPNTVTSADEPLAAHRTEPVWRCTGPRAPRLRMSQPPPDL